MRARDEEADLEVEDGGSRRGLFGLLRSLPDLVTRLIRNEVESVKAEILGKLRAAGLGAGLAVGGILLALVALGALTTAAIAGLHLVLPQWLSALIVGLALLVAAAILLLVGVRRLKRAV